MSGISMSSACDLFEIHVRGELAKLFKTAGVEPTKEQWQMLKGEIPISMREISDIAFNLGFDVTITIRDREEDVSAEVGNVEQHVGPA